MALELNLVEVVLKKNAFYESIAKVVELTEGVGSKKGENYLSDIQRFKVKVLLASGRHRTVHLIVKNALSSRHLREVTAKDGFFVREIMMYRDVLPAMKDILEEMGDTEGRLWPKCYASRLYDQLIFEDLVAAGYVVLKRKEQLNLQRSLLIMDKLAKFHALSKMLLDSMRIPLGVFQEHALAKNDKYTAIACKNLSHLVGEVDNWGGEWKEVAMKLKKALLDLGGRISSFWKGEPTDWTVLNHGDCWTNNILFKNEVDSEYSIDAKFIDLQLCFIGSPAYDLHYFMVTSVQPQELTNNLQVLLQKYANSLKSYLLKFGYKGTIPTLAHIKEEFTKTIVMQLVITGAFVPLILGEEDTMPDFEELTASFTEAIEKGLEPPTMGNAFLNPSDHVKRVVKRVLRDAVELNVI